MTYQAPTAPPVQATFSGPLYSQVAAVLRGRIAAAEWTSQAPMPNEVDLAKSLGVSIGTMRKALEILEKERLIKRQQGRGTFIIDPSEDAELERFSNIFGLNGRKLKPNCTQRSFTTDTASHDEMKALAITSDAQVIRCESVWMGEQGHRLHERLSVAATMMPGLEAHQPPAGPLFFALYRRHYGVVVAKVEERIAARAADQAMAQKLGTEIGQPLIRMTRIARDKSGRPVEFTDRHAVLGATSYIITMT